MDTCSHQIVITSDDHRRLTQLLHREFSQVAGCKSFLTMLKTELERAAVVDAAEVPSDVVTMDSVVELLDLDSGQRETFTLVYPEEENVREYLLSILSPVGTAILGFRVGDPISWPVPVGVRRMKVLDLLYQPERDE